jgi:hypothetical protein
MAFHLPATKFSMRYGDEAPTLVDGKTLRDANDCDKHFSDWVEKAKVGDVWDEGGAAPELHIKRIV